MKKQYFLGANTPKGFCSFYDNLISLESCKQLYIIKGGPGSGKSSLMKKVASYGEHHRMDVDYVYCSGDPDSLDAVVLPKEGIAIVDGTSPHVMEPVYPGVTEALVDLSSCWDKLYLRNHRGEIIDLYRRYKKCYQDAYCCLSAAKEIRKKHHRSSLAKIDLEKMQSFCLGLADKMGSEQSNALTPTVKRFIESPTCFGTYHYLNELLDSYPRKIIIEDRGDTAPCLLEMLQSIFVYRGVATESYYSAMTMELGPTAIVIPSKNMVIAVSNQTSLISCRSIRKVHMTRFFSSDRGRKTDSKIEKQLYRDGIQCLAEAKSIHDELEKYYSSAMDFEAV